MRVIRSIAILLTGLALIPGGAHVLELWNKLSLPQDQYFVVQQIYRGWALLGIVILAALIADLALSVMLWRRGENFGLAALACVAIIASLAVFFVWVYPGNLATANWTASAPDWQALRLRWEYGHAAAAGLMFVAFCAVSFSRR